MRSSTVQRYRVYAVGGHFVGVNKMVGIGSESRREIDDIMLTHYACTTLQQNISPITRPSAIHCSNVASVRALISRRTIWQGHLSSGFFVSILEPLSRANLVPWQKDKDLITFLEFHRFSQAFYAIILRLV